MFNKKAQFEESVKYFIKIWTGLRYYSLIVLYVYYYFTDLYEFGGKRLNGIAVLSEMSQTKCVFEKLVEIQYIALTESIWES